MTTPVARKLGMKSGVQALIIAAPPDYLKLLAPLPDALTVPSSAGGKYPFVQVFATRLSDRFAQKLSLPLRFRPTDQMHAHLKRCPAESKTQKFQSPKPSTNRN